MYVQLNSTRRISGILHFYYCKFFHKYILYVCTYIYYSYTVVLGKRSTEFIVNDISSDARDEKNSFRTRINNSFTTSDEYIILSHDVLVRVVFFPILCGLRSYDNVTNLTCYRVYCHNIHII